MKLPGGSRSRRLVVAIVATLGGLALWLLEQLHFNVALWLGALAHVVTGIPVFVVFGILSWPVALVSLALFVAASIAIYAVPIRFTRREAIAWSCYAVLIGPALGGAWSLYVASFAAPPGSRKICYDDHSRAASGGKVCLYETTFTAPPHRAGTTTSQPIPHAMSSIPMLTHPTPLP